MGDLIFMLVYLGYSGHSQRRSRAPPWRDPAPRLVPVVCSSRMSVGSRCYSAVPVSDDDLDLLRRVVDFAVEQCGAKFRVDALVIAISRGLPDMI